jgi:hypothetical protein
MALSPLPRPKEPIVADHWFDVLNKAVIQDTPRRAVLFGAVAATVSLVLGSDPVAEAAKHRKKRRKRPDKPKPCGATDCQANFTDPADIAFCQTKCGRCKKAGTAFCIHLPDDEHPTMHATCCTKGEACCGGICCGPSDTCCQDEVGRFCVKGHVECCPEDRASFCTSGEACCPGVGCIDVLHDASHCGSCHDPCSPGQTCREGLCEACAWSCCHANDSGTCVGPRECCSEPCSTCIGRETCLRWRDGIVGSFCEERPWTCGVVSPPCIVDGVVIACCGEGRVCTPTGCERE